MEIQGIIYILHGVRTLHLDEFQGVALESKVDGGPHSNIADSVSVGLARFHGKKGLGSLVTNLSRLAIDLDAIGPANGASTIQEFLQALVTLVVPIAQEDKVLIYRIVKGNRNKISTVDLKATNGTRCLVQSCGGEVVEASNLVLDLEMIGEVLTRQDGAHGTEGAILPGVLPLLHTIPGKEEWLVKIVKDIDNNVVVGSAVDLRTWELAIDEDALLGNTQWGNGTIGDIPFKEMIGILSMNH